MNKPSPSSFKLLQETLWPIKRHELKKFFPMLMMLFFICFDYSILRSLKDTLVVKGEGSGAEILPFLKVWGILPGAILATLLFTRLSNRFSPAKVFNILTGAFLAYFTLFVLVIYPSSDYLHPHAFADSLQEFLGDRGKFFVALIRNWTFSTFYVISELWATMVLGVLFWGFANEVTELEEAGRFYGILHVGSNIATTIAGYIGVRASQISYHEWIPYGTTAWEQSMLILIGFVILGGIFTMLTHGWMHKYVLSDPFYYEDEEPPVSSDAPKKPKMSFRESLSCICRSKYLICIAVIVVGYNLSISLVEILWKGYANAYYPAKADFNACMNWVTVAVGALSTITALFVPFMIKRWGMTLTTLLTPLTLLFTGAAFFLCLYLPEAWLAPLAAFSGVSVTGLIVFIGSAQNTVSKAAKYTLFDTTKEMIFIPLDSDQKIKAKAAIDGIGSRLGKSGSSLMQQGLIVAYTSLSAITTPVLGILSVVLGAWIYASWSLGKQYEVLAAEHPHTGAQRKDLEQRAQPIYETLPEEKKAAQAAGL